MSDPWEITRKAKGTWGNHIFDKGSSLGISLWEGGRKSKTNSTIFSTIIYLDLTFGRQDSEGL